MPTHQSNSISDLAKFPSSSFPRNASPCQAGALEMSSKIDITPLSASGLAGATHRRPSANGLPCPITLQYDGLLGKN